MDDIEALKAQIAALESELKGLKGTSTETDDAKKSRDYSTTKYVPKNPLGMRDYSPQEMATREHVMNLIRNVFKAHGAVAIETPVVELKATLTGKYGEDSKLIYDLADQGGEILALRYDLTVPFARYCAQYNVENLKRYHIARVYRRDRPVMAKGRYREFYQCDLDIAGAYHSMLPDAECLKIVSDAINALGLEFKIKVNHRKLLDGIFAVSGVPDDKLRPICSAVDKLDKMEWHSVKQEMISKGISDQQAEMIWSYVQKTGGVALVEDLLNDKVLSGNPKAKEGLEEMKAMFGYCEAFGLKVGSDDLCQVVFDLSLARGLDYYTGMIFEAIGVVGNLADDDEEDETTKKLQKKGKPAVTDDGEPDIDVAAKRMGSIAGGGRYDGLVGMFKKNNKPVPCVGLSLGIERLFVLYGAKEKASPNERTLPTEVLVCAVGAKAEEREDLLKERLKLLTELWQVDIRSETQYKLNPKALTQFQFCEENQIPFAVIIAPEELSKGLVKLRNIATRDEVDLPRAHVAAKLKELLSSVPRPH